MEITKEMIEAELGVEIDYFKLEPLYDDEECIGLSVRVVPKQEIKYIDVKITINNEMPIM